jgi:hypothetical protein
MGFAMRKRERSYVLFKVVWGICLEAGKGESVVECNFDTKRRGFC